MRRHLVVVQVPAPPRLKGASPRTVVDATAGEECRPRQVLSPPDDTIQRRHLTLGLVILAVVVASILRFANLGELPPALNQDEAVNGYDAYSLLLTSRDHHGHPFPFAGLESFGDWVSPLLTFLTVPAVGAFGLHTVTIRGVAAVAGVLAVPILYGLGAELFRRRAVGIGAAWFIALDPWAVHRSRFAIPPTLVPTMVALTLLILVWTVQRQSNRGVVALGLVAALAVASYPTMKLYIPLLLLAAFTIYHQDFRRLNLKAIACGAAIFGAIAGPIYYLSLADASGRARLDQVSAFTQGVASPTFFLEQYRSYFSPWVFFVVGNGHPAQAPSPPGIGVEPVTWVPFLLAGALWLAVCILRPRQPSARSGAFLLGAAFLLYPIPGSLTVPTPPLTSPHLSRGIQVLPLLALLAGIGAMEIGGRMHRWQRSSLHRAAKVALILALLSGGIGAGQELIGRYADYFQQYTQRPDVLDYFQFGLEQALSFVRNHETEVDTIWITDTNQPYIYVLFYDHWPPADVQQSLHVQRTPPHFDEVTAIGKYHFGSPPGLLADTLALRYTVRDPAGRKVYEVREGTTPDQGRVLLVRRP